MDALKDACRASGDYSITLIPYYAQVIADFDTADTVRQRRFESLQKLHGQLHLYKKRGYDAELLCSLAARKAELIMKASTNPYRWQRCQQADSISLWHPDGDW